MTPRPKLRCRYDAQGRFWLATHDGWVLWSERAESGRRGCLVIARVLARFGYVRRSADAVRNAAQLARIDAMLDDFDVPRGPSTADRVAILLNWYEGAKRLNCEHLAERIRLGDSLDDCEERLVRLHVHVRARREPLLIPRFLATRAAA